MYAFFSRRQPWKKTFSSLPEFAIFYIFKYQYKEAKQNKIQILSCSMQKILSTEIGFFAGGGSKRECCPCPPFVLWFPTISMGMAYRTKTPGCLTPVISDTRMFHTRGCLTPVYLTPGQLTPMDIWHRWMFDTGVFDTKIINTNWYMTPMEVLLRYT